MFTMMVSVGNVAVIVVACVVGVLALVARIITTRRM
jgi:hypothetical protein